MERAEECQSVAGSTEPPLGPRTIAIRAVSGAAWTISTSIASRAVGLAGTLLLTRYLAPEAYGEVSLAAVVVQTSLVVSSCGFSQYIVARPNEGRAAAFHATFYFTLIGVVALAVTVALREPLGVAVGAPAIAAYVPGLALAGLLERVATVQDRIQVRAMRFRTVGALRSLGEVTYAAVTVALAWAGLGAAAIVWGSLARSAVRLGALSLTTPFGEWLAPSAITWQRTKHLFAFGVPMSIGMLAGFGSRRWDNLVFARLFGESSAGIYNLAYNVADIPASQIGETIGDVLVPSFTQMRDEARRTQALLRSMRILVLIVAPLAVGLGAIAPTLVASLFDPRWADVAPMLMILSVLSVVRPIGWVGASYLQVKDQPRAIMIVELAKTAVLLAAVALLGRLGPLWACAAVGLAFAASSVAYLWLIGRSDGLSMREQIVPLLPPVAACAPMVLAVLGTRRLLAGVAGVSPVLGLAAEMLAGALVFVPAAFAIAPAASRDLTSLLAGALRRAARRGA